MSQVISTPQLGMKEEQGKDWHRAEALRRLSLDLSKIYDDIPKESRQPHHPGVRKLLWEAGEMLAKAKLILAPPPPAPRIPLRRR